jgi:pimeloyl-ACP methyl ester carboxylesterase
MKFAYAMAWTIESSCTVPVFTQPAIVADRISAPSDRQRRCDAVVAQPAEALDDFIGTAQSDGLVRQQNTRNMNHFWTSGVTALAVLLLPLSVAAQQPANTRSHAPPGKLVDIGGWRLHLNCTGENKPNNPTVVLEAGWGDFSFDWSLVQPEVARFTRVCSYDRAGHAWSDLGPRPRTMRQIAYELHTALVKLGMKPPYVLVGHSFGGLLVRTFASQYPKEVAGMILVDSAHEDDQRNFKGKVMLMREFSLGRAIPPIQTSIPAADKTLSVEERQRADRFLRQIGQPRIEPPYNRLPPEIQQVRLWALAQPQHYAADDDAYSGEEYAEIYSTRTTGEYPLGDIPLIVLTRGKSEYPDTEAGGQLTEREKRMQADLLHLSRNSKQIIAEASGHHIQLDDPALVIRAIRRVVDSALRHRKLMPVR